MRILHICLANFYIDNYSYQENILPKMHKKQGHEVKIIASTETFIDNNILGYLKPSEYINENGIPVIRLPYNKLFPSKLVRKLRIYNGFKNALIEFKPDIIFLHDVQFLSIKQVVKYIKVNPHVIIYADGHADFSNSAMTFLSKNVLHKIIYKYCVDIMKPYVKYFYGTLPARVDFFLKIYKTSPERTKLLVMGADDDMVIKSKSDNRRKQIRDVLNIVETDFVIITGGKIDQSKKQTLELIQALNNLKLKNTKLIIFGSIAKELQSGFDKLFNPSFMINIGWVSSENIYDYFEASDLVIFPGRHSVLWEQAVGQGKPCIFKYYPGHTHIDLGGNCKFLYEASANEIEKVIQDCIVSFDSLKKNAEEKGLEYFSYYSIAKRSIE